MSFSIRASAGFPKMLLFLILACLGGVGFGYAQPKTYTLANAHSHNDYEQKRPFRAAYELGFGSIEADVFLKDGELYVAHNFKDISPDRTLKALYLEPLLQEISQHNGWPYANRQELQWLIDIKNTGPATLAALQKEFAPYRKQLQHVRIVISGEMPDPAQMAGQDELFTFDGRKNEVYPKEASPRVKLVSSSIMDFGSHWDGKEPLNETARQKIKTFVELQHAQKKLVRLWATPNTELGYRTLQELGVDYIGTDDLAGLAAFLGK
ncbi:phosphatidylinositol-specific phospholipase C/glycerophosphodiester phosphodiesterase family protein [Salmonirosea aquatica]|uniref:Alkaline phosphatase n=1 Tax=Salmonirosea aquatica TaxID=2654236 RepID=A0A7C9BAF4_9BACT|nr:alkaline phosphatase [Cytophagaceae bacterium SJW1-29]